MVAHCYDYLQIHFLVQINRDLISHCSYHIVSYSLCRLDIPQFAHSKCMHYSQILNTQIIDNSQCIISLQRVKSFSCTVHVHFCLPLTPPVNIHVKIGYLIYATFSQKLIDKGPSVYMTYELCCPCMFSVACDCHPYGSESGSPCFPDDNPSDPGMMSGTCRCRANVEGERCKRCKSGYYGLSQDNPDGCLGNGDSIVNYYTSLLLKLM